MPNIKIDLNIHQGKKRKAEREEADQHQQDIVWPTMLEDDEPLPLPFKVKFFDGATIDRQRDNAGYAGVLDSEWRTINGWTKSVTEEASVSERYDQYGIQLYRPQTWYVTLFSNDPDVDPDVIEREYGPDNDYRWDRKPLKVISERDEYKRWTPGHGEHNIRLQFKQDKDGEPRVDVSPDLIEDGDAKKRARLGSKDDGEYFIWGSLSTGVVGLYVEEIGTKTMGHYLDTDVESGNYTYDWIDCKGVYFPHFDTTDTDNFKVTRVPLYNCDDEDVVGPYFINPAQYRELSVYWMPRRWGYYRRRIDQRQVNDDAYLVPVMWECTGGGDGGTWELIPPIGEIPGSGYATPGCTSSAAAPTPCWQPAAPVYCEGSIVSSEDLSCNIVVEFDDNPNPSPLPPSWTTTTTYGDGQIHPSQYRELSGGGSVPIGCEGQPQHTTVEYGYLCIIRRDQGPEEQCHQCDDFVPSSQYQANITEWYGDPSGIGLKQGERNIYIDVLVWYDRPPIDFHLSTLADRTIDAEVTNSPNTDSYQSPSGSYVWGPGHIITMIGDESKDDAIAHATAANVPEEEIEDIVGGYNSYHLFGWNPEPVDDNGLNEDNIWVATDAWGVTYSDRGDGSWYVGLSLASKGWIRSTASAKPLKTDLVTDYPLLSPEYRDDPSIQGLEWYLGVGSIPNTNPPTMPQWVLEDYAVTKSNLSGHPLYTWHASMGSRLAAMEGDRDVSPDWSLTTSDIPTAGGFSCGICPCKVGFLVAVIKLGNDAYYIWRKTDEQFTTRTVTVGDGVEKFYPGFEPGVVKLTHGTERKATSVLSMPEWYCSTRPAVVWPWWPFGDARNRVTQPGSVPLDPPIYIMFSREPFFKQVEITLPDGRKYTTPSRFMRRNVVWPDDLPLYYAY